MSTRTIKRTSTKSTSSATKAKGSVTYDTSLEPTAREVVSREKLGEGFVFSIKVPPTVNSFETQEGEKYDQFGRPVNGGWINFHIFGNPEKRGKKIRVEATVWKKTMDDGSEYLYVDLKPTDAKRLSHELKIYKKDAQQPSSLPEGTELFTCYGEIFGSIAFVPIDHDARIAAYAARG